MKKLVFILIYLLFIHTTTLAQTYNGGIPSDWVKNAEKSFFENEEKRVEKKNKQYKWEDINERDIFDYGIYAGYSLNKFVNIGTKLRYKDFSWLLDIGGNKSVDLGVEEGYYNNVSAKRYNKMNTHIINCGFTYDVTNKFYAGILFGFGLVGTTHYYKTEYESFIGREYELNKTLFNGGFVIGYKFNIIDLSVKYTNLENITFRVGFNFSFEH